MSNHLVYGKIVIIIVFSSSGLSHQADELMPSCSVCLSVHTKCFFSFISLPIRVMFALLDRSMGASYKNYLELNLAH